VNFLEHYSILAVLLGGGAATVMLVLQRWRWSLLAFGVEYLAVIWFCLLTLSPGMAVIKLISGVMAAIMLAGSPSDLDETNDRFTQPGWVFRLLAALLIWVVVFSLEPLMAPWIPGSTNLRLGGMLLIALGLLQLGLTSRPGRVILGLLTTLAGFSISYSALEKSVLVTGLLAVITLGLAFTGSFLLSNKEMVDKP
jgi:hypothetical protein